ncbi:MAG: lytic murein transglycosylase [Gammaproteobacteria bacterium]|nr:lytic murein transglycosylase [Gammaproteobacteria bacterium]
MAKFFIGLLLIVISIIALMFVAKDQQSQHAPMPWDVTIMPDGNPSVFTIHLGTTNYQQAQEYLRQYGKTAAFTEAEKASTVEAFFDSIHLGGLDAKLVLNLAVPQQQIDLMLTRAAQARIQPSGARRYDLSNQDNAALINAKVNVITYIPSVRLSQDMVTFRFGDPTKIEHDNETDSELWFYAEIGLSVRFKQGEKTILQYQMINN